MERLQLQEAFENVKPLCVELINSPSVASAIKLRTTLETISDGVVQDLTKYLLLPITLHIKNNEISKDVKQHLIDVARTVIAKGRITNVNVFFNLYGILLNEIYDNTQQQLVIPFHEELKMSIVLCLKELIKRSNTDVIEAIYQRENAPILAKGIYVCISIAKVEKWKRLRIAAMETVMILSQVDDENCDTSDKVLQYQVADVLMFFLPGLASALEEIAISNEIQGHLITVTALRAWGKVISLVMADQDSDEGELTLQTLLNKSVKQTEVVVEKMKLGTKESIDDTLKNTKRDAQWIAAASSKLSVLIKELEQLRKHSHPLVRKQLAESLDLLLTTCFKNLKANFLDLVEIMIALSEDEDDGVKQTARKSLENISHRCKKYTARDMVELLEENFYSLLTRLPRIIRTADSAMQLSHLNQFCGYVKLLGDERLPKFMSSAPHLQRLLLAMIYVVEMNCSEVSLLEDHAIKDLEDDIYLSTLNNWRRLKFLDEAILENKFKEVCRAIGIFGDIRILVDGIFQLFHNSPQFRKELVLILNWTIGGNVAHTDFSYLKEMVELFVHPDHWYLPLEVSEEVPLNVAQSNMTQSCLLLEGLGIIAEILKEEYQTFLLKTLYLVIERAGSRHNLLRLVGLTTLRKIATSQDFESVEHLLKANLDYISYHVIVKLKKVKRNPGVLDVVSVVVGYSTMEILPHLKEIVADVLLQSALNFQREHRYSFLKVLHTFILCTKSLTKENIVEETMKVEERQSEDVADEIVRKLWEYYEAKKASEDFSDPEVQTSEEIMKEVEENYQDENLEEEKQVLPPYVKMVVEIMERSLHFVPSKDVKESLLAMQTLQDGLYILSKWEDELLPVIHKLWHPLVERFREKNPLTINRAWQLLCTVARLSNDFVRGRTLKQVLPGLKSFLSKSAKESYKKEAKSAYTFSQLFKLQRELLSQLAPAARDMNLGEKDVWDLLDAAQCFLSSKQHPILQECCINLFKEMSNYKNDLVWVKCLGIWHVNVFPVPGDKTFDVKKLQEAPIITTNEYQKNTISVINYIQDKINHIN